MKIIQSLITKNDCYKNNVNKASNKYTTFQSRGPLGLMLHSVGCPQPSAMVFIKQWDKPGVEKAVHGFIEPNGDVYKCMPWNFRGWHGASGSKGSVNDTHAGFEMTEPATIKYTGGASFVDNDPVKTKAHVMGTYAAAVELFAAVCAECKLDPLKDGVVISHAEGCKRGIASNHGDVEHLWGKFGLTMNQFRQDVKNTMSKVNPSTPAPAPAAESDKKIWDFLTGKGLNTYAVAGIMGNLFAESGLNPRNLQNSYEKSLCHTDETYTKAVDNGTYTNFVRDCAGYGLPQWTYWSRKQALLDFAKAARASIGDLTMQLNFMWKELQSYTGVMTALKGAKTVLEASNVILTQYEKPADQSAAAKAKRAAYGQGYYDKYAGKTAAPSTPAPSKPAQKSVDEIAREVIRGSWGNGQDRVNRLTAAGYDAKAIQARVNQILK